MTPEELQAFLSKLAANPRRLSTEEFAEVRDLLLQTGFDGARRKPAAEWDRTDSDTKVVGSTMPGMPRVLIEPGTQLTARQHHTAKRIADGAWDPKTTTDDYTADLRRVVSHPRARFYAGYDGPRARLGVILTNRETEGWRGLLPTAGDGVVILYRVGPVWLISGIADRGDVIRQKVARWTPRPPQRCRIDPEPET